MPIQYTDENRENKCMWFNERCSQCQKREHDSDGDPFCLVGEPCTKFKLRYALEKREAA
jgi:hypothetical protein